MLGIAFATGLVAYVAVARPWLGRLTYDRPLINDGAKGRTSSASLWPLLALIAPLVVITDLRPEQVGVSLGTDPAFTVAVAGAMVLVTAAIAVAERLGVRIPMWAPEAVAPPRTAQERRGALATAVVAGVIEEFAFRGLIIGCLAYALGLPLPIAAALSLALNVLCHVLAVYLSRRYLNRRVHLGAKAVLMVALGGAVLTAAYVHTGSLLLPLVMRILLEVRALQAPRARGANDAPVPVRG